MIGNLTLFVVLSALYSRKKFDGQIWWLYVLAYGALRFAVEFFRDGSGVQYLGVLTVAQIISAVLMLAAVVALWGTKRLRGENRAHGRNIEITKP